MLTLFDKDPGPLDLTPQYSKADPPTAISAAQSQEAKTALTMVTARCLLLLASFTDGLTDAEAIENYCKRFPDDVAIKGICGCSKAVSRSWLLLKPNDYPGNKQAKNLNLIRRSDRTRINRYTGRKNVVFEFIEAPTVSQITEWRIVADYGQRV